MSKRVCFFTICLIITLVFTSQSPAQMREYERIRTSIADDDGPLGTGGASMEYGLSAGDKLDIFVWQHSDLSMGVDIGPDGKFSYPLVGIIVAVGKTVEELQSEVTERLSQYVVSPVVTITITEFRGHNIIMLGEVNYPGIYTYNGTLNLIEALALAGDFTDSGKRESVIVVSDNLSEDPTVRRVNLYKAIRQGTSKRDIILKPNDIVYVPRHFIADLQKFWSDYGTTIDRAQSIFSWRDNLRAWYHHGSEN